MKNSNKIYIISSLFILIDLALVAFCIFPLINQIEKNSEDLISAKNDIAVLGAQNIETKNFKLKYASYKPNFDKIDQLFIDPSDPVDFIKFLEDTASDCRVTSKISLPPSSQQSDQDSIIFQLSSKGDLSGILDLSKKIESGPYLIELENLVIQNSDTGQGGDSANIGPIKDYSLRNVEATFTIKAFTKK